MNFNELSDISKTRLNNFVSRHFGINKSKAPDTDKYNEQLDRLMKISEKEGNPFKDKREINKYLMARALLLEDRDVVFNPTDGVASVIAVSNQSMSNVIGRNNNRWDKTIDVSKKLISTSSNMLKPTEAALSNKDYWIDRLERNTTNETNAYGDKPFDEQDLEAIEKIKAVFEIEITGEYKERTTQWDSLKGIERAIVKINEINYKERDEYYNYWEKVHDSFNEMKEYLVLIQPFLDDIVEIADKKGDRAYKSENLNIDISAEAMSIFSNPTQKKLIEQLKGIVLPNYVLKLVGVEKEEKNREWKAKQLVYEYLKLVGKEIPKHLKPLQMKGWEEETVASSEVRQRGHAKEGEDASDVRTIDPTAADDIAAEAEEMANKIQYEMVAVDPLFLLITHNNDISQDYYESVLDEAKEEIKNEFDYGAAHFAEDLNDLLDDHVSEFLENYRKAQSAITTDKIFHIPILDNTTTQNILESALDRTIDVEVLNHKGVSDTKIFDSYSEAVDYINNNTKKFFKVLGDVLEISRGAFPILDRAISPRGIGTSEDSRGLSSKHLGGISLPLPLKQTEVSAEAQKDLDGILKIIEEYYIKPLTSNMTLLDDMPLFFESKEFRDFPLILQGSPQQQARKSIAQGYDPLVESSDYTHIIEFLRKIQRPDELIYGTEIIKIFDEALNSFVKFWYGVSMQSDSNDTMEEIQNEIEIVLGHGLYEIADDTDPSAIENNEVWEEETLSYWKEQFESGNYELNSLLGLLESPEYERYIESKKRTHKTLKKKHDTLIGMLKKPPQILTGPITHAMLEATDIIRKMNGQKSYVSNLDIDDIDDMSYVINLIQKEHNVDIYGVDIYNIVSSPSSFNDIASQHGVSSELIYKVKGLFR